MFVIFINLVNFSFRLTYEKIVAHEFLLGSLALILGTHTDPAEAKTKFDKIVAKHHNVLTHQRRSHGLTF